MSSRLVTALLLTCCLAPCFQAEAQKTKSPSDLYADAVTAYFAKDYNGADSVLTGLIEDGTGDPRAFYIRGLSRYASGNLDAADIDFEAGARLEYSGLVRVNVPRSLERIQGPVRRVLEKFRRLAQRNSALASRPHKKERALLQLTADGTEAFLTGKHKVAVQLLDVAASNGSNDPRTYYFRGLAKQELGLSDEATTDYKTAIGLELHPANRIDVDLALESVQGETRLALEKHRHEAISAARKVSDKERQAMIASLIEKRTTDAATGKGGAAIAKSAIGLPPGAKTPIPATTTPTTSPAPSKPAAPSNARSTQSAANENALNIAWLPVDSEVVINIRVRELTAAPMLAALQASPEGQGGLQIMKGELNLEPRDIDSFTIGISGAVELAMRGAADPSALASGKDQVVIVVRTRAPFDSQVVQRRTEVFEAATHDGKQFYRSLNTDEIPSVYIADSKTVVLAEEEQLKTLIDQGAEAIARPEFEFVDASSHIAIAFVPNDPFALTEALPTEGSGSDAFDRLATAVKDQLLGLGITVSLSDSLELEVRALCVDNAAATEVDASIGDLMNEAKGLWALAKAGVPTPIAGVVDSVIRAQKNSATAEVAALSTRLSAQSIERAVESAKEMLPMLMMGAMSSVGREMVPDGGPAHTIGSPIPGISSGPGEPAIPPAITKEAAGLTISVNARTSESYFFRKDGKGQRPRVVELVMDIEGEDALKTSKWGFIDFTIAKDSNNADLSIIPWGSSPFLNHPISFRPIFIANVRPIDDQRTQTGFRIHIPFAPMAQLPAQIQQLEGELILKVIAEKQTITIEKPGSELFGKEIIDAQLEEAGIRLRLDKDIFKRKSDGKEFIRWKITHLNASSDPAVYRRETEGYGLQIPRVADPDGNTFDNFGLHSADSNSENRYWTVSGNNSEPVPDNGLLQITIVNKIEYVRVPISLNDIQVTSD